MTCKECNLTGFELKRNIIRELLPLFSGLLSKNEANINSAVRTLIKENVVYEDSAPKDDISKAILSDIKELRSASAHFVVIDEDQKLREDVEFLRGELNNHIRHVSDQWKKLDQTINHINATTADLYAKYDNLEQYGRRETLEIHNVPQYDKNEDTLEVVKKFFGSMMDEEVRGEYISTCHRLIVPKDKDCRNKHEDPKCPVIYVKFVQRDQKISFLKRKWLLKGKRNSNGYSYFINENLTERRRILFNVAKNRLREAGWQYVWTKNGNIKARWGKGEKTVNIDSYETLESILEG